MPTSVLLISAETLPNVLFIRAFPAERYVFITTQKMEEEKRSHWIVRAAGIKESQVRRIKVNQDDFGQVSQALQAADLQPSADWRVNITGGNKLMSIATFDFFARHNAAIFYLAVDNKHFQQLFPENRNIPITTRLNIAEYLAAYGIRYEAQELPSADKSEIAHRLYKLCMENKGILSQISEINPEQVHQLPKEHQRKFFSGEWFEFWVYEQIRQYFKISSTDSIAHGLKLFSLDAQNPLADMADKADNEIDVCFIKDNYLFVMECKVLTKSTLTPLRDFEKYFYKLSAIKQNMGLNARTYLITPNNLQNNKTSYQALMKRCQILRLPLPIDYQVLQTEQSFHKFLLEKF
jgi:hypothetical protein